MKYKTKVELTNAEIHYIISHLEWSTKYHKEFFKEEEILNPYFDGKKNILKKLKEAEIKTAKAVGGKYGD